MELNKILMKLSKALMEQMIGLTKKKDNLTENIIVTEKQKIYKCVLDYANEASFEEKTLSVESYEKVVVLVEELLRKQNEHFPMIAATHELSINYKNIRWSSKALEICESVQLFLEEIWENSGESVYKEEEQMNNRVKMKSEYQKKMEGILDKSLVDTYCVMGRGGLPGTRGTIVTYDKKICKYAGYNHSRAEYPKNDVIEIKELNEEEYLRIVAFIESEILNKEYEDRVIYDVSFVVRINYKGITKEILNNTEYEIKTGIYDLTTQLLQEIWDNSTSTIEKTEHSPESE